MKKGITLVLTLCILLVGLAGCGNNSTEVDTGKVDVIETNKDYMEKYISELKDGGERASFLSFWNSMCSYCRGLELKLREVSNGKSYTFDPTDESSIPAELKDLYDFSKIRFYSGVDTHENYEMKVNGEKVEFSFDGETFYPTNYGYTDVKNLVDKYNAE